MYNKNKEKILKNYTYINITLLFFTIYIILFPYISKLLNLISPSITKCPYLEITGKPCPLCGGTRYISELYKSFSDITYLFCFFGFVMIFVLFELIFRIFNIIYLLRKKTINKKIIIFDIIIHSIAFIAFLMYELIFIICN